MSVVPLRQARRLLLGALAGGLLVLAQAPGVSHAILVGCRADPIVTLSNGVTFELTAQINTSLSSVTHVSYTLHLPPQVTVRSVSYPDGTATISSFTTMNDNSLGNYDDYTLITSTSKATATAYFVVDTYPVGWVPTNGAPAQGSTGQNLHIHLQIAS